MWTANDFLDGGEPFSVETITPQAAQPRRHSTLMACVGVFVLTAGASWGMQGTKDLSPESAWELTADEMATVESRRLGLLRIRATVLRSVDTLREMANGGDQQLGSVAQQTIDELRNSLSD